MADTADRDEKTEDATPRRLQDARQRGQVAYSAEFSTALSLLIAVFALMLAGRNVAVSNGTHLISALRDVGTLSMVDLDPPLVAATVKRAASQVIPSLAPILIALVLTAALSGFGQVGFAISGKSIEPDLSKLNLLKGFKRIFSMRGVIRTGLAILKLTAIAVTMVTVLRLDWDAVSGLAGAELGSALYIGGRVAARAALAGIVAVIVLSVLDLLWQRYRFAQDMKMTKQEVKDEAKSSEGDPQVKAKIRRIQRDLSRARMMADVPDATVVVTNPTHYAVALKYAGDGAGRAPIVVAKGVDHVAQKIKEVARENGVLVFEDPPLARALHRTTEIGDEIPEDLFAAVARVLAYVYRLEGKKVGAR